MSESEAHSELASLIKTNMVDELDELRRVLSVDKRVWGAKIEQFKKQVKDANDMFR